jgi:hypothetical protein
MKVITSIYLNCRPDLRDEWLTGTEVDDVSDAQVSCFTDLELSSIQPSASLGPGASSPASCQVL